MQPGGMLLRVRSQVGMWRVEGIRPNMSIGQLKDRVLSDHHVSATESQIFSLDPNGKQILRTADTIGSLGLRNGDVLYLSIREEDCAFEAGKKIAADGTILNKTHQETSRERGFRPGMNSLRSMKMHWTLTDFVELDSKFEFKIKAQKESSCSKAFLDANVSNNFIGYMQRLGFAQCRMGYLYGTFTEANVAKVEIVYEPPQDSTPQGFELLEDPKAGQVEALAEALKLQKVGWVFAHPSREKGFVFTGTEVITAAVGQLEAAGGVNDTPFVTVRVCQSPQEEEGPFAVDAYQVSKQCMEMVAEEALSPSSEPGALDVNETFTVIVEGKAASRVDHGFFLVNVPVASWESERFVTKFPRFHRLDEMPSQAAMKAQFSEAGKSGWTLVDLLSDFHLLLFLADFLDMHEMAMICHSILDRSVPLGEGHEAILRALAGD